MGEWFENRTEVQQDTKKVEKTDFQLVWVEQKEGQDELKINQAELDRFKKWIESQKMDSTDRSYFEARLDWLESVVSLLSEQLDSLMDVSFMDKWEMDIKDWQDTLYMEHIAHRINHEINQALLEFQQTEWFVTEKIDSIFSKVDKWTEKWENVQRLKSFIWKLEGKKQEWFSDKIWRFFLWDTTVDNIQRRNDPSSLLEWWTKVKY